jgi:nitroreductase
MNVHEAIRTRRSVRRYSPRLIPEDSLTRLRDALRLAPSACNYQPWRFVFVTDQKLRAELAQASHQQAFIARAPLIVVACGFPDRAYQGMGGHGNSVDVDLAIALDHLTLAAVAEGLGTCWIGSFDEPAVKRLLEVPPEVKVVALTPVGFPESSYLIRPVAKDERKPEEDVFSVNHFAPR